MDKRQNLMPQAAQPVNRTTTGQLPAELAQLSEEALFVGTEDAQWGAAVLVSWRQPRPCEGGGGWCSYDGDDAE
jgi:bacteriocin leader peptide (microcyclamide/patellamide family)